MRVRDRGAQGADHDRHMFLFKQPLCRGHPDIRLARIVGVESFYGPTKHAAGFVDVVQGQLGAILLLLPPVGRRAAKDRGNTNFYRFGGLRERTTKQARGDNKNNARHLGPSALIRQTLYIGT